MRVPQRPGTRGSLQWIQRAVSEKACLLNEAIERAGCLQPSEKITWVSPQPDDDWAEYRDGDFLDRIGHKELRPHLADFWPTGGPQWDALGRGSAGTVLLVEAKAHIAELMSTCQASAPSSRVIERALNSAKNALGVPQETDWLRGYYQYANRLAHLHFLREHRIPAALVFVYFVNDSVMSGPRSLAEWSVGLAEMYKHLALPTNNPIPSVANIYIDVSNL
jgi:hypothetical protein